MSNSFFAALSSFFFRSMSDFSLSQMRLVVECKALGPLAFREGSLFLANLTREKIADGTMFRRKSVTICVGKFSSSNTFESMWTPA